MGKNSMIKILKNKNRYNQELSHKLYYKFINLMMINYKSNNNKYKTTYYKSQMEKTND